MDTASFLKQVVTLKDKRRFLAKITKGSDDECWPYNKATDADGYGVFWLQGKTVRAHQVALAIKLGRWPEADSLHDCDNPPCCNPKHLHEGSSKENMSEATLRNRRGGSKHAHRGRAKLSSDQAYSIRRRIEAGEERWSLAFEFNLSPEAIAAIASKKTWWPEI